VFWNGAWTAVSQTNPLPTASFGPGNEIGNPLYVHPVLKDANGPGFARSMAGVVLPSGVSGVTNGIAATMPHVYTSPSVMPGVLPDFKDVRPMQGDPVFSGTNLLGTAVSSVRTLGLDDAYGNYQISQKEAVKLEGVSPDDGKIPTIPYGIARLDPQNPASDGTYYYAHQLAAVNTTGPAKGYANVVQIAESTNAGQYLYGAGQKTSMVRTNAAADGVSQQLCMTNLDATAVKNEDGGVLRMAGYSSDGKTSWDRPDGSIVPSGDISRIASTAVMTTTQLVGPLGVTRCQLVDGDNNALSVVNGVLSATLSDTANHPLQVNTHAVGTSSSYVLAVESVTPADGTLSVEVVDPVLEWLQSKAAEETKEKEVWQQCVAHYKRDAKSFVAKARTMQLPLDQVPKELRKFFDKGASSPSG
jgi:hypothetical protein